MRGPDFSTVDWDNLPPNESIISKAIISMAVSFTLVILTLALRLYCRFMVVKKPGWDDWTIILATACSLIQLIFNALFIHYGEGRHVFYLTSHQIILSYKFSNLVILPFIFCTAITKISIAFMVLRLTQAKWMKIYMYTLMATLVLVNGACIVILFGYCRPTHALWDITVRGEKCWNSSVLTWGSSVQGLWSVLTDLICTSTPLVMIWKLRMGTNQKVAVTILIGLGLATTGCSIGRCIYYYRSEYIPDQTWNGIDLLIWTTLEANIGIFASNLPALGFLRKKIEDKLGSVLALPYFRLLSSNSKGSSDREKVPTFGGGGVQPKRDAFDSVLGSDDGLLSTTESRLEEGRNIARP